MPVASLRSLALYNLFNCLLNKVIKTTLFYLIKSNKIKAGDLINWCGHIAIIIGVDEENFYIAESLPYLGGVVAKIYPKKSVMNTFEYVVLMDKFYEKDGNYTAYWE